MSYQVLSRKWRPQHFDEVVGQSHVTRTLQNAMGMDRVAHGYIFAGPRGVGKTTTARILAKVLNCEQVKNNNPCSTCSTCVEITQGSSLDVQELDGASNRGIDEIRELREAVKYPPNKGKYRIYIIDEVHMLTGPAFNALLKTLEEPPPHVIFIMATTDSHKVPATILSRTQRFDFKSIAQSEIEAFLIKILESESQEYDPEGIKLIAQKGSGSLRDSLSLLDQIIAYAENGLDLDTIRDVLGIIDENVFLDILQQIQKKDSKSLIGSLNHLVSEGYAISDLISGMNEFFRNCMLHTSGVPQKHFSEKSINWLDTQCTLSTADFLRMLDISLQYESNLKFMQQPLISLEALFMKFALLDSSINISQLLSGNSPQNIQVKKPGAKALKISEPDVDIEDIPPQNPRSEMKTEEEKTPLPVEKTTTEEKVNPETVSKKPLNLEDIRQAWPQILKSMEEKNSKIAHFLEDANLKDFKDMVLQLKIVNGHRFHVKTLEKDTSLIESVLHAFFKQKFKVKFHIEESNALKTEKKKPESSEHPLFTQVIETFEGEIIR
ncbi:MAG: DNA polymerase III subunit gamma/tau [Candidatus Marinimicrobia bacterium]|nr:DNA polymerase III subunit gamma/tau [Candidatus Neomarinimicrobiota bacterium]